jgi:hypothetical protein
MIAASRLLPARTLANSSRRFSPLPDLGRPGDGLILVASAGASWSARGAATVPAGSVRLDASAPWGDLLDSCLPAPARRRSLAPAIRSTGSSVSRGERSEIAPATRRRSALDAGGPVLDDHRAFEGSASVTRGRFGRRCDLV